MWAPNVRSGWCGTGTANWPRRVGGSSHFSGMREPTVAMTSNDASDASLQQTSCIRHMMPAGLSVLEMSTESAAAPVWNGHSRGSVAYGRLLAALFCAGVATFAQLYSPQAVLPLISADLGVGAASAALMVSASTVGLAIGVIPWSTLADRIGRVRAISMSVTTATAVGLLVPFAPTYQLLLAGRLLEGLFVGGVPAIAVAYLTEEIDRAHAARA